MIIKQIKHNGDNFSYLIADEATREAAVIDPAGNGGQITELAVREGLKVRYVITTHHHRDHVRDADRLRDALGAKVAAHRSSKIRKDITLDDGSVLVIGGLHVRVIHTPGHTEDSITILAGGAVFTGDTLFVGECGRTDLPGSNPADMYDSLFNKLMRLDDDLIVYPGHDYGPSPSSTMGLEKRTNYTLKERSMDEFVEFMKQP